MKVTATVLLLSLLCLLTSQSIKSTWKAVPKDDLTSQDPSILASIGRSGLLSWKTQTNSIDMHLRLYQDDSYSRALDISLYFDVSVNGKYPYYNRTATATYSAYQNGVKVESEEALQTQPRVEYTSKGLKIYEQQSTWQFTLQDEPSGSQLVIVLFISGAFKAALFVAWYLTNFDCLYKTNINYVLILWLIQLLSNFMAGQIASDSLMSDQAHFALTALTLTLFLMFLLAFVLSPTDFKANIWDNMDKSELAQLVIRIVGVGYGILTAARHNHWVNAIVYSLLPLMQIRHNQSMHFKLPPSPYLLAIYLINIVHLVYLKGLSDCPLRLQVQTNLCLWVVGLAALMVLCLWAQGKFGPYLCLRKALLSETYLYSRQLPVGQLEQECQVCNEELNSGGRLNQSYASERGIGQVYEAPCGHYFHPECLEKYIQTDAVCGVDGTRLPPIYE